MLANHIYDKSIIWVVKIKPAWFCHLFSGPLSQLEASATWFSGMPLLVLVWQQSSTLAQLQPVNIDKAEFVAPCLPTWACHLGALAANLASAATKVSADTPVDVETRIEVTPMRLHCTQAELIGCCLKPVRASATATSYPCDVPGLVVKEQHLCVWYPCVTLDVGEVSRVLLSVGYQLHRLKVPIGYACTMCS